jgi:hypothetical protein
MADAVKRPNLDDAEQQYTNTMGGGLALDVIAYARRLEAELAQAAARLEECRATRNALIRGRASNDGGSDG